MWHLPLAFVDPTGSFFVLDVSRKDKALRLIGIYVLNDHTDWPDLFQRIETFLDDMLSGSFSG